MLSIVAVGGLFLDAVLLCLSQGALLARQGAAAIYLAQTHGPIGVPSTIGARAIRSVSLLGWSIHLTCEE